MFRILAKTSIACAYSWTGAGRWWAGRTAEMPFIIGYHRVVEDFDESARNTIPSMLISAATFEKHLDWLSRKFCLVSLDDIGRHLGDDRRFSRPAAAITFDDGYADVYRHAFPILKRKGIPAAVFVVTGQVGTSKPQVYDRLYMSLARQQANGEFPREAALRLLRSRGLQCRPLESLDAEQNEPLSVMTLLLSRFPQTEIMSMMGELETAHPPEQRMLDELAPLSWEMITEMQRGGMTIGSHTKNHVLLTSEPIDRARQEISESKEVLERQLNQPVLHFAYPDGRFNPAVVQAVREAGYRFGYTVCRRRDPKAPLLTIPRKVLWERASANAWGRFSGAVMNCHANWVFDSKDACEHNHE